MSTLQSTNNDIRCTFYGARILSHVSRIPLFKAAHGPKVEDFGPCTAIQEEEIYVAGRRRMLENKWNKRSLSSGRYVRDNN